MNARRSYLLLRWIGWALLAIALATFAACARSQWKQMRAETPHLDGEPGSLREALGFPWKDFPSIPDVEKSELEKRIPIDPPMRISDVRPWLSNPSAPALGGGAAARNGELQVALRIMDEIARNHSEATGEPATDASVNEERSKIAQAQEHLASAESTTPINLAWLVSYNRGVLYRWQGNRQKAAKDFRDARLNLKTALDSSSSEEVLSAGAHVLYALGDALIDDTKAGEGHAEVSDEAVRSLREAVILSVRIFGQRYHSVTHAARFIELTPTRLSTRTLRNDLLVAYLLRPEYQACPTRMAPDACGQPHDLREGCGYRDNIFCATLNKASDTLSGLYKGELKNYLAGTTKEGALWALQTVAEMEAENTMDQDNVVAYNVAHLLLSLKQPELAYDYLKPLARGDQTVSDRLERLTFVTSILAGQQPTAISEGEAPDPSQSEYRTAYMALYKDKKEPEPFRQLRVGDAQRSRSLDAWLFIRRYHYLLSNGQFEAFIDEHRQLMKMNVPHDFLARWKKAVVVEFLKRVKSVRSGAQGDGAQLIDGFIGRSDLFQSDELQEAGLVAPFLTPVRSAVARIGLLALLWLALLFLYLWLCAAYKWTFLSSYRTDREAAAGGSRA